MCEGPRSMPAKLQARLESPDAVVDHVRGAATARLTIEYGDWECRYSGIATGEVSGTPTQFVDAVVHRGGCDVPALLAVLGE
jgi:hypothetical protein